MANRSKVIEDFLISENVTIKETMQCISKSSIRILFVVDNKQRLLGSISDGDIRRWVLKGGKLGSSIKKVYRKLIWKVDNSYDIKQIKKEMIAKNIQVVPVVGSDDRICHILFWEEIFGEKRILTKKPTNIPCLIMAGGLGTRLDPFTRVLPKPLIPIGEKTIIEMIIEKFHLNGVHEFNIAINHKSKIIKAYFEELNLSFNVNFVEEKKPLGTIGALNLISDRIKSSVFVANCDVLIDCDYQEIIDFHKEHKYDMTIVGSFRHFLVPYGVCHLDDSGHLNEIEEKPEFDFLVNSGMYLIKKKVLKYIPKNKFFNAVDLVNKIRKDGCRVGVFPINENSWVDVGQWEDYHQAFQRLNNC